MQEPNDVQMDQVYFSFDAIPAARKVSAEELKRRQTLVERMAQRSSEAGAIGIRADDLLYMARIEAVR